MSTDDIVAIQQLLARYARGVDRLDPELIRSAYWPDAIDNHGAYVGGPAGFADWVCARIPAHYAATGHVLGQILVEVAGDEARVESYFRAWHAPRDAAGSTYVVHGRYLDRMARRDGEWRILERRVVRDLRENLPFTPALGQPPGPDVGAWGSADPSHGHFGAL
jgi:hypothetical protein